MTAQVRQTPFGPRALGLVRLPLGEVGRKAGRHSGVGHVSDRLHAAAPGNAHDLTGTVESSLPATLSKEAKAGGNMRREQIVEQYECVRFEKALADLGAWSSASPV